MHLNRYIKEFCLKGIFTEDEIKNIDDYTDYVRHPLSFIFSGDAENQKHRDISYRTQFDISRISYIFPEWFKKKKKLLVGSDHSNSSSSLGEIRALSALSKIFTGNVKTIKENSDSKNPDFLVDNGEYKINVEVYTVRINEKEQNRIIDHMKELSKKEKSFAIDEISYNPFGNKHGAGTILNAISKICSAKEDSDQFDKIIPNILWIDLQDEDIYLDADSFSYVSGPIFSNAAIGNAVEGFYSNPLWYSLYAKKDYPVYNGEHLNSAEGIKSKLDKMPHNGKFHDQNNLISAVVFYTASGILLYENPNASIKLPDDFVSIFTSVPYFKIESSRMKFPNNKLNEKIESDADALISLSNNNFYSW